MRKCTHVALNFLGIIFAFQSHPVQVQQQKTMSGKGNEKGCVFACVWWGWGWGWGWRRLFGKTEKMEGGGGRGWGRGGGERDIFAERMSGILLSFVFVCLFACLVLKPAGYCVRLVQILYTYSPPLPPSPPPNTLLRYSIHSF